MCRGIEHESQSPYSRGVESVRSEGAHSAARLCCGEQPSYVAAAVQARDCKIVFVLRLWASLGNLSCSGGLGLLLRDLAILAAL